MNDSATDLRTGRALGEHVVYDPDSGQALRASLMDCTVPRFDIIRNFHHMLDRSIPSRNNPLGVKGVGELGTIGATPAVVSAVVDALARARNVEAARTLQMPLTPPKVWQALRA